MEQAELRLRADLEYDITFAAQFAILEPCADAYLDGMQANLVNPGKAHFDIIPGPQSVEKLREKAAACLAILGQPRK